MAGARSHATPSASKSIATDPTATFSLTVSDGCGIEMPAQDPRGAENRMAAERDLVRRREHAHAVHAVFVRGAAHKGRLREVHLGRHAQHPRIARLVVDDDNGERIAGIGPLGKDIDDVQRVRHDGRTETGALLASTRKVICPQSPMSQISFGQFDAEQLEGFEILFRFWIPQHGSARQSARAASRAAAPTSAAESRPTPSSRRPSRRSRRARRCAPA